MSKTLAGTIGRKRQNHSHSLEFGRDTPNQCSEYWLTKIENCNFEKVPIDWVNTTL